MFAMVKMTYVEADGTEHDVDVPVGLSVMEGALNNGVPGIDADCGGACSCATCHVHVDADWIDRVGPPSADERDMLEFAVDVADNSRLSCQIGMRASLEGLIVHLPVSQR
jgi:2Fe-2S ferredoxin